MASKATKKPKVAGIILAAGLSSRMGGGTNKLTTPYRGAPLVSHAIDAALGASLSWLGIVTGHHSVRVTALAPPWVETVYNPRFASGMASSLVCGVNAALRQRPDGLLIMLGDMPLVTASHLRAMVEAFEAGDGDTIVVAADGRYLGNPVLFANRYFPDLLGLSGDQGARGLILSNREHVVPVDIGHAAGRDFDTPEAFLEP